MKIEDIRHCAAACHLLIERERPKLIDYSEEGLDRLRRAFIVGYHLCMAQKDPGTAREKQQLVKEEIDRQKKIRRELEIQRDAILQRMASVSGEITNLEIMLEMGPQALPTDIRPGLPE